MKLENCKLTVVGDKLTIEVDLKAKGVISSTGKTLLVASTRGAVPVEYKNRAITVALNVMAKS